MSVNLEEPGELHPVPGVRLGTAAAAIKSKGRDDVTLIEIAPGAACAAVFTRNSFRAAPVIVAEARIAAGGVRALVINSGNANAATGEGGIRAAESVCRGLASHLDVAENLVAPFSTGVIGEPLPVERILPKLKDAVADLDADHWLKAARAIMTTDTVPKAVSRRTTIGGRSITLTGIAKGAGMIRPDMATMLAFVCCDAAVEEACLRTLVREAADASFNRITIDGDTSTNDSFVVVATGAAGNSRILGPGSEGHAELARALGEVCRELAQKIVRDGEGATRFVTVRVLGGANEAECLRVAYTIAESPLVKTAIFAGDPNWGRLTMAIGRAGVSALDTSRVSIHLADVCVMRGGLKAAEYTEEAGASVMARAEFEITIDLGRGDARTEVWTTDLSYEYVKINAEYRS